MFQNNSYEDACSGSKFGRSYCNKAEKFCHCQPGFCAPDDDPGNCKPDPTLKCRLVLFDFDSTLTQGIDEYPEWFKPFVDELGRPFVKDGAEGFNDDVAFAEKFAEKLKEDGEGGDLLTKLFGPKERIESIRRLLQDLSDKGIRMGVLSYHQYGQRAVLAYLLALDLDHFFVSIHATPRNRVSRYDRRLEITKRWDLGNKDGWDLLKGTPMLDAVERHKNVGGYSTEGHMQETLLFLQRNPYSFWRRAPEELPGLLAPEIMLVDHSPDNLVGLSDWGFKGYASGNSGLLAEDAPNLLQQCNLR